MLIAHAEPFIKDLGEVENGTLSFVAVKAANQEWVKEVKQLFFKLTDAEAAPIKANDWTEQVLDMAGWIVDMSMFLENSTWDNELGEKWLMKNSISRYLDDIERLQMMESENII